MMVEAMFIRDLRAVLGTLAGSIQYATPQDYRSTLFLRIGGYA